MGNIVRAILRKKRKAKIVQKAKRHGRFLKSGHEFTPAPVPDSISMNIAFARDMVLCRIWVYLLLNIKLMHKKCSKNPSDSGLSYR
jgi:hypothetical protein